MAEPAEPDGAGPKGQRRAHLDDPGWVTPDGGQGRFAAFPLGDGDDDPLVVVVEYAPGVRIGVHSHGSDYWSMVTKGSVEVTRRIELPGSIRLVRAGTAYGPLVVGDEGATVVEVFADRRTFAAPAFLDASESAAAAGSPMPDLVRQAVAAVWSARSNSNS
jgi:anti-sigma factor ChrR (cupin superfamily)